MQGKFKQITEVCYRLIQIGWATSRNNFRVWFLININGKIYWLYQIIKVQHMTVCEKWWTKFQSYVNINDLRDRQKRTLTHLTKTSKSLFIQTHLVEWIHCKLWVIIGVLKVWRLDLKSWAPRIHYHQYLNQKNLNMLVFPKMNMTFKPRNMIRNNPKCISMRFTSRLLLDQLDKRISSNCHRLKSNIHLTRLRLPHSKS